MENIISTYRFVRPDGRRVAVFACPTKEDKYKTVLFILDCSRKDSFSKKRAREIFNNWLLNKSAYYTTTREVVVKENGKVVLEDITPIFRGKKLITRKPVINIEEKQHICHPQIEPTPFECTHSNVNAFLRLFLKRYVSTQTVLRELDEIVFDYKQRGYLIAR